MAIAVVRVRGKINIKPDIKKTLNLLNLTRANHCVIIQENKYSKGMLQVVKDYVTWGEIETKTLSDLISKRGKLSGDREITDKHIKTSTSFENVGKLSEAITKNKIKISEIPEFKPVFRLNPPKKGLKSVKRPFTKKGSLGYRGKEINALIEKMI